MASLNVKINNLELSNPVMTASGTFGYGLEFADLVPLHEIGGIIVKGTTLRPREGNNYPRMKSLRVCSTVWVCRTRVSIISAPTSIRRLRISTRG